MHLSASIHCVLHFNRQSVISTFADNSRHSSISTRVDSLASVIIFWIYLAWFTCVRLSSIYVIIYTFSTWQNTCTLCGIRVLELRTRKCAFRCVGESRALKYAGNAKGSNIEQKTNSLKRLTSSLLSALACDLSPTSTLMLLIRLHCETSFAYSR